jgi:hypothetical protein
MTSLTNLQKEFRGYLLKPAALTAMLPEVVGNEKASAEIRLGIYADAYRLRLAEALANDFEAVHGLLGDEQFHELCLKYIDAHPSQHFSLRYFGQHMSSFLRHTSPYSATQVLAELADFEWALIDAFDAPDGDVLSLEEVAGLAPERWPALRFTLHESVIRLKLAWNVQAIWKALKEETPPDAPQRIEPAQAWVVWRQELQTYFRVLEPQEAWALDAVQAGHTFASLCEGMCKWVPEDQAAAGAAGFLHRWVREGLIRNTVPAQAVT